MTNRFSGLMARIAARLRGGGVGTEDPNIVGDAGPTDIPPGRDPDHHDPGAVTDLDEDDRRSGSADDR